jgi:hypothetical protein
MLSGYKNPYAADYTNQLTMPQTPDLTNIKKSFENNPTSADLLKVANTEGRKLYQPATMSTTPATGQSSAAKPGTPNTTDSKVPAITTDTSVGKVVTPPTVNPPVVNPPVVNPNTVVNSPVVNPNTVVIPPVVNPPVKTVAEIAAERQAEVNRLAALARNPDGGPSSLAPSNNITSGPQQVTLDPNTVVSSPSGINALSAQTVALPPSGPQPINPSNGGPTSATVGPITAAQRDLGPLNISNLGAVIGPQAMNSNAGGVASLVGPQGTVQPQSQPAVTYTYAPSSQQQLEDKAVNAGYQGDYTDTAAMNSFINANNQSVAPAVTQQPAVQASAVPSTQVLDSSGTPIPGRRRLGFA